MTFRTVDSRLLNCVCSDIYMLVHMLSCSLKTKKYTALTVSVVAFVATVNLIALRGKMTDVATTMVESVGKIYAPFPLFNVV